jgi:hypothetical protein
VGWAVLLFLVVLLLVHGLPLLDGGVVLDNTRQYGPPLVAARSGDAWLAAQPQIQYFADASPRLYRLLVGGALGGLPVVAATKALALVLLLPLAAIAWGLGRVLWADPVRAAGFAVLLLANAVFSNQMLTGTPRDLGTVLFLGLLLALLRRRFGWMLAALVPLVGVYPTFGLLALAMLWLALLSELRRPPRPWLLLLLSPPLAALGLKLLGPTLSAPVWGPTLRLFGQSGLGALAELSRRNAEADGLGPSVARYLGFVPSPAHLLALLGDKRFRFLPAPGEHAFGWLGAPLTILVVVALLAGAAALLPRLRRPLPPLRWSLRWPLPWPQRVLVALALASLLLYLLSFVLAFRLHNPNRYGMMPAVLLLSGVEMAGLSLLLGRRRGAWLLPWLLALALPLLRVPVDPVAVPADALAAVARSLGGPRAQLLVVDNGERASAIANALPLTHGVRVFYAEEMDRGFQMRAIRDGQELRAARRSLSEAVERRDPGLAAALAHWRITHVLGSSDQLAPLAARPACLVPIPEALALLPVDCLAPAPEPRR